MRVARRLPYRLVMLGLGLPLAGCASGGTAGEVPGFPGIAGEVRSYYEGSASEQNRTCLSPRIEGFTRAEVVEDTPERLVLRIGYFYDDWTRDDGDDGVLSRGAGGFGGCNGFGTRRFVLKKTPGGLDVVRMSGPR